MTIYVCLLPYVILGLSVKYVDTVNTEANASNNMKLFLILNI